MGLDIYDFHKNKETYWHTTILGKVHGLKQLSLPGPFETSTARSGLILGGIATKNGTAHLNMPLENDFTGCHIALFDKKLTGTTKGHIHFSYDGWPKIESGGQIKLSINDKPKIEGIKKGESLKFATRGDILNDVIVILTAILISCEVS